MGNNKQEKSFKIAVLAIVIVFATLFYIEYARSNRYIAVPNADGVGYVFDIKKERSYPVKGLIENTPSEWDKFIEEHPSSNKIK